MLQEKEAKILWLVALTTLQLKRFYTSRHKAVLEMIYSQMLARILIVHITDTSLSLLPLH